MNSLAGSFSWQGLVAIIFEHDKRIFSRPVLSFRIYTGRYTGRRRCFTWQLFSFGKQIYKQIFVETEKQNKKIEILHL